MSENIKDLRNKFLQEIRVEAAFYGFEEKMLASVEKKLQLQKNYHIILFPGGIKQIVCLLEDQADSYMISAFKEEFKNKKIKTREKIKEAVMLRLRGEDKNNKIILSKISNFYCKPTNYNVAVKNLWQTVSEIWYLAGDESTDFNYYSKRFLLFPIYKATLIYYISDSSKDDEATEEFLERRIENVMKVSNIKKIIPAGLEKLKSKIPFIRLMNKK